jgi:hypothetical protein
MACHDCAKRFSRFSFAEGVTALGNVMGLKIGPQVKAALAAAQQARRSE